MPARGPVNPGPWTAGGRGPAARRRPRRPVSPLRPPGADRRRSRSGSLTRSPGSAPHSARQPPATPCARGDLGERVAATDGVPAARGRRAPRACAARRRRSGRRAGARRAGAAPGAACRRACRATASTGEPAPQAGQAPTPWPARTLGDRDLLALASQVGARRVRRAAVGRPGGLGELQAAVVAVAGVDAPVAAGLAVRRRRPSRVAAVDAGAAEQRRSPTAAARQWRRAAAPRRTVRRARDDRRCSDMGDPPISACEVSCRVRANRCPAARRLAGHGFTPRRAAARRKWVPPPPSWVGSESGAGGRGSAVRRLVPGRAARARRDCSELAGLAAAPCAPRTATAAPGSAAGPVGALSARAPCARRGAEGARAGLSRGRAGPPGAGRAPRSAARRRRRRPPGRR